MYSYIAYIVHGGSNRGQAVHPGPGQMEDTKRNTWRRLAWLVMKTRWDFYMENTWNIWKIHGKYIWVNFITTSLFSRALEIMVYVRGIIPFYGRTIQISELL